MTGLGSSESDLDLCLFDPTYPDGFPRGVATRAKGTIYDMDEITQWLQSVPGVKILHTVKNAKVPIVKFEATIDGQVIQADINTNNRLRVINSRLINTYCALKKIVRPLIKVVRYWAKQQGLNDSSGQSGAKSLSSYTLALLVLAYFQSSCVLPNLRNSFGLKFAGVRESFFRLSTTGTDSTAWDTRFVKAHMPHSPLPLGTPLLSRLVDFFPWVSRLNMEQQVVHLARGGLASRQTRSPHARSWLDDPFVVVDPFQLDRNTTRNIKPHVADLLKADVDRAVTLLEADRSWAQVCARAE